MTTSQLQVNRKTVKEEKVAEGRRNFGSRAMDPLLN